MSKAKSIGYTQPGRPLQPLAVTDYPIAKNTLGGHSGVNLRMPTIEHHPGYHLALDGESGGPQGRHGAEETASGF